MAEAASHTGVIGPCLHVMKHCDAFAQTNGTVLFHAGEACIISGWFPAFLTRAHQASHAASTVTLCCKSKRITLRQHTYKAASPDVSTLCIFRNILICFQQQQRVLGIEASCSPPCKGPVCLP